MVHRPITLASDGSAVAALAGRFERARADLLVVEEFPAEVLQAAACAAADIRLPDTDLTDLGFVTVDPPGATDLDQALYLRRDRAGYLVDYAIADVPAFVGVGGPVSDEAFRRGQTLYCPDRRTPLHPPVLSEGAASLLPGQVRPAFVWRFRLDQAGAVTERSLVRATVRSRHQLDYQQVQAVVDGTRQDGADITEQALLLAEIGRLRLAQEQARGGASLPMPEQEVGHDADGYRLTYRPALPAEDWNAQLSLLTGMAAAGLMLAGSVGVLRTMPAPDPQAVSRFRRQARALGVTWAPDQPYGRFLRGLDRHDPAHLALVHEAAGLFRGAGYVSFDGAPPPDPGHAAMAAPYAHVTAPLRRLVDRFGLLICQAVSDGAEVDETVRAALPRLVERMAETDRVAKALERRCVDLVEAAVLADRVGQVFDAVAIDRARDGTKVQLLDPAVVATCTGELTVGEPVRVRLSAADPDAGTVRFVAA